LRQISLKIVLSRSHFCDDQVVEYNWLYYHSGIGELFSLLGLEQYISAFEREEVSKTHINYCRIEEGAVTERKVL